MDCALSGFSIGKSAKESELLELIVIAYYNFLRLMLVFGVQLLRQGHPCRELQEHFE